MNKTLTILLSGLLLLLFNCNEKIEVKNTQPYKDLFRQYDSVLKLTKDYVNSPFYQFHEIYKSEKGNLSDTILISKYKDILTEDEIVKVYIDNRIETIYGNKTHTNIISNFKGRFSLGGSIRDRNEAYFTSVEITNDSCYLYKHNKVLSSSKIKLINSKGGLTRGMFYVDNRYLINLYSDNFILVKDNNCLHCGSLHFQRIKEKH